LEINGQRVASLETGETYTNVFDAGNVVITTDNWTTPGKFTLALNAEAGTEYKLELLPRGESVMAGVFGGAIGMAATASVGENSGSFKLVVQEAKKPTKVVSPAPLLPPASNVAPQTQEVSPVQTGEPANAEGKLTELKKLYDKGLLSKEIYIEKQREVMGGSK